MSYTYTLTTDVTVGTNRVAAGTEVHASGVTKIGRWEYIQGWTTGANPVFVTVRPSQLKARESCPLPTDLVARASYFFGKNLPVRAEVTTKPETPDAKKAFAAELIEAGRTDAPPPGAKDACAAKVVRRWDAEDDGITKLGLEAAYGFCAMFCAPNGVKVAAFEAELRAKYAKLNVGMQKMNLVNRVRAAIARKEKSK